LTRPVRSILLVFALVAIATTADAKFAQSQGFSGKHGVDCGACHIRDPVPVAEATVRMTGLPDAWEPNASYPLSIEVGGGPTPNPVPGQAQGGFDLETDGGVLSAGAGMQGLLRTPSAQEVTYTGEGTARRSWSVVWAPPGLASMPVAVRFWVGAISANGNHIMGGPDSAGERGDRVALLNVSVPAGMAARQAWFSQPLAPPVLEAPRRDAAGGLIIAGRVADAADGAEWRLDGNEWIPAVGAPAFIIHLDPPVTAHMLEARALWQNRTSSIVSVILAPGVSANGASARPDAGAGSFLPMAVWAVLVLALLLPLVWRLKKGAP
jgi:hypothetical protein